MGRYRVEISRTAQAQLKRLPRDDQTRVVRAILALADDPFPKGSRKLSGYTDVFRIRIRHYRVIYSAAKAKLIVIVLKISNRKDIYR